MEPILKIPNLSGPNPQYRSFPRRKNELWKPMKTDCSSVGASMRETLTAPLRNGQSLRDPCFVFQRNDTSSQDNSPICRRKFQLKATKFLYPRVLARPQPNFGD
ncbi:hypothetical protein AVEN_244986-1 [Araneus ventricosus]|uniref:Uncharacterized protein n=1 Tax=Araneus ventricosus TaxID=182803 RepID=A0A4Y2F2Z3_ARAVE|nr:hypothetical protein AVEN_244986-1 [Araneus ventricosus]